MGFESLKYDFEMIYGFILITGIDKSVIYEYYDEPVQVLLEQEIHQVYESCWSIGKTK